MTKLIAVSPVGKNGQVVVPAAVRRLFKISGGRRHMGFFMRNGRIEIAPVSIERTPCDYTEEELDELDRLAREPGGRTFKSAKAAIKYIRSL